MLTRVTRLRRLSDQLPPQWYGRDDQGNPVYIIIHKGFLSIRRGGCGGGLESAQVGDEIYTRQVDISWDPGYGEIRRLCEDEVELPEMDHGDMESSDAQCSAAGMEHCGADGARRGGVAEHHAAQAYRSEVQAPDRPPSAETLEAVKQRPRSDGQKGLGGDDIDQLLRKWTSSLSATEERPHLNGQTNLNRVRFEKLQKIREDEINVRLRELLERMFSGRRFEVLLWVENSHEVADSVNLKLLVLKKDDPALLSSILRSHGASKRRYCNTLLFLVPSELERRWCVNSIRYALACEAIIEDRKLSLSHDQKKVLHQDIQRLETAMAEAVRKLYRIIRVPEKDGYRTIDLGAGAKTAFVDQVACERLLREGVIAERIEPLHIRDRYLKGRDYLFTADLYARLLTTPGETRPLDRGALAEGIRLGVQEGTFGIGRLEEGVPLCRHFMERAPVTLEGNEIILSDKCCLGRGVTIR